MAYLRMIVNIVRGREARLLLVVEYKGKATYNGIPPELPENLGIFDTGETALGATRTSQAGSVSRVPAAMGLPLRRSHDRRGRNVARRTSRESGR
jgi:hypothetical protein